MSAFYIKSLNTDWKGLFNLDLVNLRRFQINSDCSRKVHTFANFFSHPVTKRITGSNIICLSAFCRIIQ